MDENDLLKDRSQKPARSFVKYRRVMPGSPLEILEMDIKFVWVEEYRRFAYVLTVLDTFTRVALCWHVGYQIRQAQIKSIWEYIIYKKNIKMISQTPVKQITAIHDLSGFGRT